MRHDVEVPIEPLLAPKKGENGYHDLNPHSEVLPKGWSQQPNTRPLTCEIFVQHDVALHMRDGITLYADVYRPTSSEKVPAVLCWSPFGKKFNGIESLKVMTPWNLGIPDGTLSGLEKFEAPDPAEWVARGYAIVNVDSRGAFNSEGVMAIMGSQEAEDGYDAIEELAKQSWCNGNVGMAGNSHLAIVQWFIAALKPPHLKAIAPWEGCGDLYREQFARGGIYGGHLFDHLIIKHMLKGRNGLESFRLMFEEHPLANSWWNDKRPDMKRIDIPTYITGTWTNTMHGMGAIRGWLEVASTKKWLRWHPYQEWYDIWGVEQAKTELLSFFDHYLKGIDNDWESTPKVRMAVLRYESKEPLANVVEEDFPLPRTDYRKLFLTTGDKLSETQPKEEAMVAYDSENIKDFASFSITFDATTRIVGIPKAVLYMSCDDLDDMDIFIVICKLSTDGTEMLNLNIPWKGLPVSSVAEIPADKRTEVVLYKGPTGQLRASNRAIDWSKSMHENWPYYTHEKQEVVSPGQIVRMEIGIWGMGIEYEAGERLSVQISGSHRGIANFATNDYVKNKGRHTVHFGGQYDSHLVLPFV
ncbi:Alpha/Beta hydrolase protein [Rhexocercosporidium sp. MPI-PUGE-AT-0058]|nr:Alpha/Beta hydrolase protein [Rhexocercosporidium sp. MPI-PUGE-AT-0058]